MQQASKLPILGREFSTGRRQEEIMGGVPALDPETLRV